MQTPNTLQCVELQRFLSEKIKDASLHKKAVSIALGIAISRMIPIPSSQAESAETHYLFQVKSTAAQFISAFNEGMVVDFDLTVETCRNYWLVRYANAFPDCSVPMFAAGEHGFLTKLAGAGRYINNDTHAFCEKNSELMVVLINRITSAIQTNPAA